MASESMPQEEAEDRIRKMTDDVLCHILSFLDTHEAGMMSEIQAKRVDKDRISALPDVVLSHILSFLDKTNDAVMTSVLSRRWKNIWASVPNLYLDDQGNPDFDDQDNSDSDDQDNSDFDDQDNPACVAFSRFVDNVLFFRDSIDIRKFRLHSVCVKDFSRICGWIGAAIRRNVVELDLSVKDYVRYKRKPPRVFKLPDSLFRCKTLTVLKLSSNLIINTPESGCFPSLKSLDVHIDRPGRVLRPWRYYNIHGRDPVMNFTVSAPELKKLTVHWMIHGDYEYESHYFHVVAPKLEIFHLWQFPLTDFFLENAKSLVKTTISLNGECNGLNLSELLEDISNVADLSLAAHGLKSSCVPVFEKLSRLELVLYKCCSWELLKELLRGSPKLEYLALELNDYMCLGASWDHPWSPPEVVPVCLLTHLKTVSVRGFEGKIDEIEVAKYLLKNCEVLNKMNFYSKDLLCTKEEVYKELSRCQWGSKSCQVEFFSA